MSDEAASDLHAVADMFAAHNRGIDTDYTAAWTGAQRDFATRSAAVAGSGGEPCKALFWFTAGKFDIESRTTGEAKDYAPDIAIDGPEAAEQLEQRGKELLCSEGGVVDGLRR